MEQEGEAMTRYEEVVVRRIVEVRATMLEAISANDINQYDADILAMRHTIDELLDLLVEFSKPVERAGEAGV